MSEKHTSSLFNLSPNWGPICYRRIPVLVSLAAVTKYHRLSGLNNKHLFSHSLGSRMSKTRLASWIVDDHLLSVPLHGGGEKERETAFSGVSSYKGSNSWRRKWQPTQVLLLGKSHGQRNLVGYSPWGHRVGHDLATKHQQSHHEGPNLMISLKPNDLSSPNSIPLEVRDFKIQI